MQVKPYDNESIINAQDPEGIRTSAQKPLHCFFLHSQDKIMSSYRSSHSGWSSHSQTDVTMLALQTVRTLQPKSVLWENVEGFLHKQKSDEHSPHDMVVRELSTDYIARTFRVCASTWRPMTRQRFQ
eukprot:1026139-Amphidinium_carterae.6